MKTLIVIATVLLALCILLLGGIFIARARRKKTEEAWLERVGGLKPEDKKKEEEKAGVEWDTVLRTLTLASVWLLILVGFVLLAPEACVKLWEGYWALVLLVHAAGFFAVIGILRRKRNITGGGSLGLLTTLKSIAITVAAIGVAGICLMLFLGLKKSVEMINGETSSISTSGIPRQGNGALATSLEGNERIIVAPIGTTNLPPARWSEEVRRDRFPEDFRGDYDTLSWKLMGDRDETIGLLVNNEKVLIVSAGEYRPNVRLERVRFMTLTGTNAAKIRIEWIEPR